MPPPSTVRGSAYLNALAIEIEKKLQRALASPSQGRNLLQELFADVALEVDDRAKDIIFGEEGAISVVDDGCGGSICFYNVLADHFVNTPQDGRPILDLIVQHWSQSFASSIFSLLFHNCLRFILIILKSYYDTLLLLSKVLQMFSGDKLESFLKQFPDFPNAFLIGGSSDIFVNELSDQIQKLKVEPVLLHYLSQIKALQGMELRMATSTRLKSCLYSFTSPGAPMYPTRAVRHAAWDALDFLFPVGRYPRHLISLFFRLLYPWYWPSSCWNFMISCIQAVFYSLLGFIFSSWEKMRKPKRS